jgi:hypothetical protein
MSDHVEMPETKDLRGQGRGKPLWRTAGAKRSVAALYSAILAFLSSLLTALGGPVTGFDSVTDGQWLTAAVSALVALGGAAGLTYYDPNKRG